MNKKDTQTNDKPQALEDMYNKIMENSSQQMFDFFNKKEKDDRYKQYSVCDLSKYDTILSSSIIIKK